MWVLIQGKFKIGDDTKHGISNVVIQMSALFLNSQPILTFNKKWDGISFATKSNP